MGKWWWWWLWETEQKENILSVQPVPSVQCSVLSQRPTDTFIFALYYYLKILRCFSIKSSYSDFVWTMLFSVLFHPTITVAIPTTLCTNNCNCPIFMEVFFYCSFVWLIFIRHSLRRLETNRTEMPALLRNGK